MKTMTKIYIIGHKNINTLEIGIALQAKDDSLTIASKFTTNKEDVSEYKYFLDKETVNISYKNNVMITVTTDDNESTGIIYDDYYNNDIFCMSISEFNVMSDKLFMTTDDIGVLIVWVDSSKNVPKEDVKEVEYLEEWLKNLNYLYFCNDTTENIVSVIIDYLYADEEKREELLKEYL